MEGEYPHIRHKLSSVNLRNNLQGHSNSLKRGIRRMDSKYSQLEESKDIPKHSRERNVSIYSDYEDDEIQMEFDNLITILSTHFAKENIYQVFSLNDVVRLHFHEISNKPQDKTRHGNYPEPSKDYYVYADYLPPDKHEI